MKWTECTADNKSFTSAYDGATRKIRDKLGSYDTISHLIFRETGDAVAGVSVRRWFINRNLPITYATTLIDLMDGDVELYELFPYLEEYFGEAGIFQ